MSRVGGPLRRREPSTSFARQPMHPPSSCSLGRSAEAAAASVTTSAAAGVVVPPLEQPRLVAARRALSPVQATRVVDPSKARPAVENRGNARLLRTPCPYTAGMRVRINEAGE